MKITEYNANVTLTRDVAVHFMNTILYSGKAIKIKLRAQKSCFAGEYFYNVFYVDRGVHPNYAERYNYICGVVDGIAHCLRESKK